MITMLAVLGGGLAGCSNPNRGDSVAVIGDSITEFDEADLQEELGDGLSDRDPAHLEGVGQLELAGQFITRIQVTLHPALQLEPHLVIQRRRARRFDRSP